jgi:N-acetylglucosaminyl-diphospho-decaprenol L-rhamnosyltransferase
LTPQHNQEQEKQPPRVSVVVVSRNRVALLHRCLEAVEKSQERERIHIVAVDNGSRDGSAHLDEAFPGCQFIRLPKNFGLTKALNIGWRAAKAEYVLFLHDDVELAPEAVTRLADALDAEPDAAAVCPLLVDDEGRPAPQLGSLPPTGEYRPAGVSGDEPFSVEYPRGAALMIRSFVIKAIRQIDERYGQFGSDAELAAQIHNASKKILLVPTARAQHQGRKGFDAPERADFLLGRAVYLGKRNGFLAGVQARIGTILGPLLGFRFGELKYTLAGQKIDGTQE